MKHTYTNFNSRTIIFFHNEKMEKGAQTMLAHARQIVIACRAPEITLDVPGAQEVIAFLNEIGPMEIPGTGVIVKPIFTPVNDYSQVEVKYQVFPYEVSPMDGIRDPRRFSTVPLRYELTTVAPVEWIKYVLNFEKIPLPSPEEEIDVTRFFKFIGTEGFNTMAFLKKFKTVVFICSETPEATKKRNAANLPVYINAAKNMKRKRENDD